jgi:GMP synthase-like glutamine amidotransferase
LKPIALFQHSLYAEPGFVQRYLDEKSMPWTLFRIDQGAAVPASAQAFSGLCFLGGSMSVNDDAPWIAQEIELIREADRADIPLIGHCFGSQLMAKAFGALVTRNTVKEIGWGKMTVSQTPVSREWLGEHVPDTLLSFQWHGDTFSLPDGAEPFLSSEFCANQAFVLRGLHLAMQCHLEMTPELVRKCAAKGAGEVEREIRRHGTAATQPIDSMLMDLDVRTAEINATLRRLYDRWLQGIKAAVPGE